MMRVIPKVYACGIGAQGESMVPLSGITSELTLLCFNASMVGHVCNQNLLKISLTLFTHYFMFCSCSVR